MIRYFFLVILILKSTTCCPKRVQSSWLKASVMLSLNRGRVLLHVCNWIWWKLFVFTASYIGIHSFAWSVANGTCYIMHCYDAVLIKQHGESIRKQRRIQYENMKMLFYRVIPTIPLLGAGITRSLQLLGEGLAKREYNSQPISLFSIASRQFLGPSKPYIQLIPKCISPDINRQGREPESSLPSCAEVKNSGDIPPYPIMLSWYSA
jgi:hypothetical protein